MSKLRSKCANQWSSLSIGQMTPAQLAISASSKGPSTGSASVSGMGVVVQCFRDTAEDSLVPSIWRQLSRPRDAV